MKPLEVPAGSTVYIGKPANPMSAGRSAAVAALVSRVAGVTEAHLPQCNAESFMQAPAQILAIVLASGYEPQAVCEAIGQGLQNILFPGEHLDIMPIAPTDSLLTSIRDAGMQIYGTMAPVRKPWWKRLLQ
jgi:hypothetical protein